MHKYFYHSIVYNSKNMKNCKNLQNQYGVFPCTFYPMITSYIEPQYIIKTRKLTLVHHDYRLTQISVCLVVQLCLTLRDPMDCSLPGSSVHEDSSVKNTGGVAMPSTRGSSQPRDRTQDTCIAGGFFTV